MSHAGMQRLLDEVLAPRRTQAIVDAMIEGYAREHPPPDEQPTPAEIEGMFADAVAKHLEHKRATA